MKTMGSVAFLADWNGYQERKETFVRKVEKKLYS